MRVHALVLLLCAAWVGVTGFSGRYQARTKNQLNFVSNSLYASSNEDLDTVSSDADAAVGVQNGQNPFLNFFSKVAHTFKDVRMGFSNSTGSSTQPSPPQPVSVESNPYPY